MKPNFSINRYRGMAWWTAGLVLGLGAVRAEAGNLTWAVTNGIWDFSSPNWSGDASVYTDGDSVAFGTPGVAGTVSVAMAVSPASIRINTTSAANYFTFTNADITGAAALTQGGGGTVQFSTRKAWSFGGGVASSNGLVILTPPTLVNNDVCHLGTNTIQLSGTSLAAQGKFRFSFNVSTTGVGVDQDFAIQGFGTLQTHINGSDVALGLGKTVTLDGSGSTLLLLEDYSTGGNAGYVNVASNGIIRVNGGASDTREIRLSDFQGNGNGFRLSGALLAGEGYTNPLVLRNLTGKDFRLTGNNAAYSNGFVVAGAPGKVGFGSAASLGAEGPGRILLTRGGYMAMTYGFAAADLARIDSASEGSLGIDSATAAAIDLSASGLNAPNLLLGGEVNAVYSGTITPYGSVYRFGGTHSINSSPNIGSLLIGTGAASQDNLLTGSRSLVVESSPSNTATFRLHLQNSNDFSGGSTVKARGILSIGRTGGTPLGSGRVLIENAGGLGACGTNGSFYNGSSQFTNYLAYAGARFFLDETLNSSALYTGGSGQGRWGDSAPVALNGGYLGLGSAKNGTAYETIGALSFEQESSVRLWNGGGTTRYFLTADSLARIGRGTLRVSGLDGLTAATLSLDGYRIRLTTVPPMVNGMLPPFLYDFGGKTFYTYNSAANGFGVFGLSNLTYSLSGAAVLNGTVATNDTVSQTADLTLTKSSTGYALRAAGGLSGSSYTVTVLSGGLILAGNNKSHTANYGFGDAEGIVWTDGGQNTLNGTVTGTNGLTKGGNSTLILGANNSATLKGPVTVNQGSLQLNHASTLGQTNDLFVGLGGTLNVNAQTNLQVGSLGGHGTIQLNTKYLRVFGNMNPGSAGSVGALTVAQAGTNVFETGSSMTFDLAALARQSDQYVVSLAAVNLNGAPVTIRDADGLEAGTYTLIDTAGGTMSGSTGSLTMPAGFRGTLSVASNDLVLTVSRTAAGGALVMVR